MINRNATRVILNTTEITDKTKSLSDAAVPLAMTTSHHLYLGFKQPFTSRYFDFSVANSEDSTLTVEFWNGSSWESVEDLIDETVGFTQSGFLSWQNVGFTWLNKTQDPVDAVNAANAYSLDLYYYWVRISVSANLSAGTKLQSVTNLFCHDSLFRTYYPELLDDARYLPPGRSDFMEQYVAAKDHVVRRMRQMGKITDEGDILDVVDVAVAACHATANIILNPIARDDEARKVAKAAGDECERELSRGTQAVDTNKDGRIEPEEVFSGTTFLSR